MPSALRRALPALALLAACAKEPPGYEGPHERQVRKAMMQLEESSGLTWQKLPVLEERTRDEVRAFVEKQFNEQMSPVEFASAEQAYRLFGMLPDTLDLRAFLTDLLTEQIAGYYDPATKVLYVVKDVAPDIREITITHELMHALQDQHTRIDSVQTLRGDNDRMVAMQAVIEGQATYEQLLIMTGGNDLALRIPGGWDQVREMIRSEQASMPKFANAPVLLQETLLFPYLSGAEFIRQFKRHPERKTPYTPFASSTEQLIHPAKFFDSIPDLPTRVTLAEPRGGSLVREDNLGEFEARLFLYQHLKDLNTSVAAASGWDGDRFQVINTPAGAALAWVSVWDTPLDAAEFRDVMQRAMEKRYALAPRSGGTGEERTWTAKGRHLTLASGLIDGRPVVVMEDAPAAVTRRLLPLASVTLQEP